MQSSQSVCPDDVQTPHLAAGCEKSACNQLTSKRVDSFTANSDLIKHDRGVVDQIAEGCTVLLVLSGKMQRCCRGLACHMRPVSCD